MSPRNRKYDIDPVELHRLYVDQGLGTPEIAKQLGWYQNDGITPNAPAVQRCIERMNLPMRNKKQAQRLALETGTATHPTSGRNRTLKERTNISASLAENYKHLSEEDKEKRVKGVKEFWSRKDNIEKQEAARQKTGDQLRRTIQEGTFLEKSVAKFLIQRGYSVEMHAKNILEDPSLECDMFVKGKGIVACVELDGPRHWGKFMNRTPDDLAQTIQTDMRKNGLVLSKRGVFMIRILYDFGKEIAYVRATLEKVHAVFEYIREISQSQPSAKDRLIILDMGVVLKNKSLLENSIWNAAMKILRKNSNRN